MLKIKKLNKTISLIHVDFNFNNPKQVSILNKCLNDTQYCTFHSVDLNKDLLRFFNR